MEINARAGLEIQNVSDTRLRNTLDKIKDLNVQDPSQGVEIAKTLFGKEKQQRESREKILYLSQTGLLKIQDEEELTVEVQVDLQKTKNYASPALCEQLQQSKHALHIELPENSILLRQLTFSSSKNLEQAIILGRGVAENFLIKPQTKQQPTVNIIKPEMLIESEIIALHQLDDHIERLHKRLNLTTKLKPQNYLNELDNFITRKGNYSPVFSYHFPEGKKMQQRKDELFKLKETCTNGSLKSPLIKLFDKKLDELFIRRDLLQAYKTQNFTGIEEGNQRLRGEFDADLVKLSKEKSNAIEHRELLGNPLHFEQIKEMIEKKLNSLKIFGIEIVENASNLSRMSLTMGETTRINISQGVEFRQHEVDAIIAHEIETHLVRYLNGLKS
ncbi:MAG: flavohemoglobin expression-modulating QEGLA motif protein [Candidatus Peribacteria bacterium]|nr:flavohemoglobin expression-modulating QEGLA motif protein [Candidatus Peribacteria bacterium]